MNVLIVDDNKNNRMILTLLLEDYMEDNEGIVFNIDEAADGIEAVNKCKAKEYALVLMDIMMPNMDGIEATKIIRQEHGSIMIIAVSAVDDNERQKLILKNGAEDYISKPVNADIFNSRVSNYVKLLDSRMHSVNNEESLNLFTKEVFHRYTKFSLSSEDALSELWEYYLLDTKKEYDNLSDVVRSIFSIAESQLKLGTSSSLYVENSENSKYFTVDKINKIPAKIVELILKKNSVSCEYKIKGSSLSFKLNKIANSEITKEVFSENIVTAVTTTQEKPEEIVSTVDYSSNELTVYNYIDEEDLIDLEEYAGKLASLMLIVGSDITEDEVNEIYSFLDRLSSIIATYSEVYPIATALTDLSHTMANHVNEFLSNSEALAPMCSAFSRDMLSWIEQSFHTGAPSVDFMNDTIVVNCQTISSMLSMDDASALDDGFDDIFDF